ncbi:MULTISPECIES: transcriptional regulator [Achromobacter]|uniref:transcriptional regulator n=1 Tax=Achromobacter TaxID=222 RepID=UPI000B493D9C|nr:MULTISPECIES: YdaS family helix-turn-helix protein [Achromobacter]
MDKSSDHPLDQAARLYGSAQGLAAELGVSKGAFSQWKLDGRGTPAKHCPTIERLTGIRCEELCPEVEWWVLRGTTPGEGGQLELLP